MDSDTKKKEAYLTSKGFRFLSTREVWISNAGEISREFVEDHSFEELERELLRTEKAAESKKSSFKLYN